MTINIKFRVARQGGEGHGSQGVCDGCGGGQGGRNNNQQRFRKPRHVSKTLAIKDDVFECGIAASAGQFKKANKAIIEYICHEGSMEPILIIDHGGFGNQCGANYCSATAASMD
jgi:hypothetical protein